MIVRVPINLPVFCSHAPDGILLVSVPQPLSQSTAHSPIQHRVLLSKYTQTKAGGWQGLGDPYDGLQSLCSLINING